MTTAAMVSVADARANEPAARAEAVRATSGAAAQGAVNAEPSESVGQGAGRVEGIAGEKGAGQGGAPGLRGADGGRWRLDRAIGLPEWLRFGVQHRARVEALGPSFRPGASGHPTALFLRTLVPIELVFSPLTLGVELQDSRAHGSAATELDTGMVNPVEVLQAYASLRGTDVLLDGDEAEARAGRITIDLGSRRLVARNRFRNTINAFTGYDLRWTSPGGHTVHAFAVVPVTRRPSRPERLADNAIELDRENTDALLWGTAFGSAPLGCKVAIDTYALGLHEQDGDDAPSRNRQLVTSGVRAHRPSAPGELDFEVELIGQLGKSRASTKPEDRTDLRHLAFATHVEVGYRFDAAGRPRIALTHDYASGDRDPNDEANERFDTLFGARRFDFGPTGLWGAFARSNLNTPGVEIEVTPHRLLDAFAGYRPVWLASARDAWTGAGLRDPSGAAGSFVGHQIEARVRLQILGKNLGLELGGAQLLPGTFAGNAPGAPATPSTYGYAQIATNL